MERKQWKGARNESDEYVQPVDTHEVELDIDTFANMQLHFSLGGLLQEKPKSGKIETQEGTTDQ